ncbi:SAM-dependent methyltransferase [Catellatospora chokoriensis]|uniref:DOT1 domain-containing protein n=1 Tax=Catellatospora chokoriensis TaxID=310353 RepID=A0A8J3JLI2_9ACTN|nr:methyltransferase domain-containing protein [Catellatospora chokoriensis]GIF87216.1 hypothetical protein Cch02nite_06600 [Catellatospora chokoriensis]
MNNVRDRLSNVWWEQQLGISTRGLTLIDHEDSSRYTTMGYRTVERVLDHLDLQPSDVFVDVGSGKGRVLCCAARREVKQVIGVELDAALCDVARDNARRLRGRRAPIAVETVLAQDFDYAAATVFFLFDPFGAATLGQLLDKVHADTRGQQVRFAYANPTHDHVFQAQPWLERTATWDSGQAGTEHTIHFYRSR